MKRVRRRREFEEFRDVFKGCGNRPVEGKQREKQEEASETVDGELLGELRET
jgi:hypothetical protein